MLRALTVVTLETFTLLRRDRIFLPSLVAALAIAAFANLASQWSIEDFTKILYDVGFFGFQLTGSVAAMFWSVKSISDSRLEGSLEVQLAAPIGRSVWLLGKYLGLSLAIAFLALIMLGVWQLSLLLGGFGWASPTQLGIFGLMVLGWQVLAATGIFFGVLMRFSLALFATLGVWLAGLAASLVSEAITPETAPVARQVVGVVARYWDLQRFNMTDRALEPWLLSADEARLVISYAIIMIGLFISSASVVFRLRETPA